MKNSEILVVTVVLMLGLLSVHDVNAKGTPTKVEVTGINDASQVDVISIDYAS